MSSSQAFIVPGSGALDSLDADVGSANPVAGVITVGGTGGISTTGVGATISISFDAVGADGQVFLGASGGDPDFGTLTSTDGSIRYTTGANALDLSVSGVLDTNAQTGTSYTLVLTDAGKIVTCENAAAITLVVPSNATAAFDIGTTIIVVQKGAGVITVTPAGGVTLSSRGGLLDTFGQYSMISLIKNATNVWFVGGDLA